MNSTHPLPTQALPRAGSQTPKGVPLLGLLPRMRKDPIGVLLEARDMGDVVPMDFGIRKVFLVNDPDLVKRVLQDNRANYPKSILYEKMRPAFGNGLLLSEGDFWSVQRRLIQPAFAHHRLEGMTRLMVSETLARVPGLEAAAVAGKTLDMADEMSALTLSIVVKAMFGAELKDDMSAIAHAVEVLNEHSNHRFYTLVDLPMWMPTARNRKARGALEHLESVVYRIIRERRSVKGMETGSGAARQPGEAANRPVACEPGASKPASGIDLSISAAASSQAQGSDDLLSMLLSARYDDGSAMAERQVRDEVMTIFLAGHETTATSLAWTLMLLDGHPAVEEKLRTELHEVLRGRDAAFADYPRLPYLRAVLEESMRVRPPVWVFSRNALADDELGGVRIPKGSVVMLSPYAMHRDSRFWEDPEAFRPERFAAGEAEKRPRYAYFPFGGGPRVCIGSGFAMAEGALVLACLLKRFRFRLAAPGPVGMRPLVTLRPRGGMPMTVSTI